MSFTVLYEDNHLIAVKKLAGEIVQSDKTGDETLAEKVKAYIKRKYKKPGDVFLGIIHRLDRPVGGVIIFARTSKSLSRMNALFREKEVSKEYWAIVEEKPPLEEGELINWLKKNQEKNRSRAYEIEVKESKKAILNYQLVGRSKNYFYLKINPLTGRHHQIRVQLSFMGCSIKGDVKYGAKRTNKDGGIHLFAKSISFIHPVKKELLTISANPPIDPLWNEFLNLS
ncbi:MAG: RNA pseudouridine synthase [Flavobacteriales bacterium]|nr:RNA pseudouridine synthase [Flavobacteriales bacterium]MDG1440353.1 RNA pseudouridine synthase [Flavobacteriales bacterium]